MKLPLKPRRPIARWHGGKWRIAEWIISHFPEHAVYVEPCGGMASVLLNKQPAKIEVYNDADEGIVNLFRILRDPVKSEELKRLVYLTPFARAEFNSCWQKSDCPMEEARRLIVRCAQAIGNKDRLSKSGWRTRTAKSGVTPCIAWNGWPKEMPAYIDRLKNVVIEHGNWEKMVDVYDDPTTLFYFDPPYLHETRSSGYRKVYANEMTTADHEALLERIGSMKSMVAISGYHHQIYEDALKGWARHETKARAQTNQQRMEVLWLNPLAVSRQKAPALDLQ